MSRTIHDSVHTLGTSLWTGTTTWWTALGTGVDNIGRPQPDAVDHCPRPQVVPSPGYGLTSAFRGFPQCPPGLVLSLHLDKWVREQSWSGPGRAGDRAARKAIDKAPERDLYSRAGSASNVHSDDRGGDHW